MKLRIRAHTLRLRLTRSEVEALGRGEAVVEETPFPDGLRLTYALLPGSEAVTASLQPAAAGSRLEVHVPEHLARDWAHSQAVGLGGDTPLEAGPMQILIEKDFDCLAPRPGDEDLDTFANPAASRTDPAAGR